jgi:hypothetical protein
MSALTGLHDRPDADEELRRLEARVVAGDLALQRQTEALLRVAADRAEKTAGWALIALGGVGLLFVLDLWLTRRNVSPRAPMRRAQDVEPWSVRPPAPGRRAVGRIAQFAWPLAATGTLWRALPALRIVLRVVSAVANEISRARRRL